VSRRLSDDEKRVFSDQISLLQNENERLTDRIEELEGEITALKLELRTERKVHLQHLLDSGLISQEEHDKAVAQVDALLEASHGHT